LGFSVGDRVSIRGQAYLDNVTCGIIIKIFSYSYQIRPISKDEEYSYFRKLSINSNFSKHIVHTCNCETCKFRFECLTGD
jgi:hypothetical protein